MRHLTQEEIVMAYYGERFEHLEGCDECRAELARIAELLDRVEAPEVPEPDADYESRVWQRLSWRLRGEQKRVKRHGWLRWGAVAAIVAIAFVAGLLWKREESTSRQVVESTSNPNHVVSTTRRPEDSSTQQQRDRILLVVIGDHFDESERILVELSNLKPQEGNDIGPERDRAEALLASNRLYRRTAQDRGQENVATLLDDLEPVLLQIAHSPSQVSASELRAIQKRVEAKGLVLKLRVVRSNVKSATHIPQPNA